MEWLLLAYLIGVAVLFILEFVLVVFFRITFSVSFDECRIPSHHLRYLWPCFLPVLLYLHLRCPAEFVKESIT